MIHEPINRNLVGIGDSAQITGSLNQVVQGGILDHFIDGWGIHRARDPNERPDVRKVENIAWLQTNVFRLVTLDQQIVEVEVCDGGAIAADFEYVATIPAG